MHPLIASLKGKLIVSVQAYPGEPMRHPETMAQIARAAEIGGAAAIRCQGLSDISAIKGRVDVPVIGLWGAVVSLGAVQGLTLLLSLLVLRRSGCIARSR